MDYQLNIDWPEFMATYWQKKPVIIKNALPDFVDPISPDELAGLAMENEIDSRLVSFTGGQWHASHGPFADFDHLGDSHWSLLVQAVNHWHIPAAKLLRPFRVLPDWRLDDLMISFSVPFGGVGPHIDQYDVFIIQGMGSRHWRVGDKLPLQQFCPHPALLHVEPFTAMIDDDLQPGDMLYIPPGFPHDGYSHQTSLSYSVGFRSPNSRDLISSFADYVLENDLGRDHYTDPELTVRDNPGVVEACEVQRIRRMMSDLLAQPAAFNQWFGSFITTPRHELDIAAAEPPYQASEVATALQQGEVLIRLGGLRVLEIDNRCFVNSEPLDISHKQAASALCHFTRLSHTELGDALTDRQFIRELTVLINQGYWYFDN